MILIFDSNNQSLNKFIGSLINLCNYFKKVRSEELVLVKILVLHVIENHFEFIFLNLKDEHPDL